MRSVSGISRKPYIVWIMIAVFCAVFAAVYEMFSFGVWSAAMLSLPVYPLLLGAVPCALTGKGTNRIWTDGILLMTAGSLVKGVLDIYGTSGIWPFVMMAAGGLLVCAGIYQSDLLMK